MLRRRIGTLMFRNRITNVFVSKTGTIGTTTDGQLMFLFPTALSFRNVKFRLAQMQLSESNSAYLFSLN